MHALDRLNPFTITAYFLAVAGIAMFCAHPVLLTMTLAGAVTLCLVRRDVKRRYTHLLYWGLFALTVLINPLFSRHGATVLLVIGNKPISLEALLWGLTSAGAVLATLYLFASFSAIMQSDKLLYLFGSLSPKLSLILSMGLRYVPLLSAQWHKIKQTQTVLGLYKEDNVIDRVRGALRIFWALLGWALENGIITAGSMTARAYGTGKRTHYAVFSFTRRDALYLSLTLALAAGTIVPLALGALDFVFYPTVVLTHAGALSWLGYLSYGALIALPILAETEDTAKWKYLRSKI
ncbi:MAG: energy-coupling factor transporter transmembrane protein EcfT [Clostridia bacterium]|nr:energy-coupling factor transporter transmembrane protein EcfT [Clostridia bacterium]